MSVSMEPELIELVDKHCEKREISRSMFIREAIRATFGRVSAVVLGHTATKQHRLMREDGKCNPHIQPTCPICHGEEE